MKVQSSVLPYPMVLDGAGHINLYNGRKVKFQDKVEETPSRWDLKGRKLLVKTPTPANKHTLCVILLIDPNLAFDNRNDNCKVVYEYKGTLLRKLKDFGLAELRQDDIVQRYLTSTTIAGLQYGLDAATTASFSGYPTVVFLLLARKDISIYQNFKVLADRIYGVHSI